MNRTNLVARRWPVHLSAVAIGVLLTQPAFAAGSSMPWEDPLQTVLESIEGPVVKVIAVIIIIFTGITVYNPARLWSMLRERGYDVQIDERSRVTAIRKKFDSKTIVVGNFGYFEKAVQHGLLDDAAAAEMFDSWVQRAVELGGDGPAKIFLRPRLGARRPRATATLDGDGRLPSERR